MSEQPTPDTAESTEVVHCLRSWASLCETIKERADLHDFRKAANLIEKQAAEIKALQGAVQVADTAMPWLCCEAGCEVDQLCKSCKTRRAYNAARKQDRLAEATPPPPKQSRYEKAWMIEVISDGRPLWWDGVLMSDSPNKGVRFSRKEDADCVVKNVLRGYGVSTEHEWVGPDKEDGAK